MCPLLAGNQVSDGVPALYTAYGFLFAISGNTGMLYYIMTSRRPCSKQQTVQLNASVSGQFHQRLNGLSPPNFHS
eukprot:scaffold32412_cov59-Attheya_sp.AAC.4